MLVDHGQRFVLAVPAKEGRRFSMKYEIQPPKHDASGDQTDLNFQAFPIEQVISFYCRLIERKNLTPNAPMPPARLSVRSNGTFSRAETIYAFQLWFALNDIGVEKIGVDEVRFKSDTVAWENFTGPPAP